MADTQSEQPLNLLELLDDAEFPATLIELVGVAEDNDASEEALDQLRAMPDREYTSIHDVAMHMGELEDLPGHENQWSSEPSSDIPQSDADVKAMSRHGDKETGTAIRTETL